jgi:predicted MarR family transcription regulator
MASQKKTTKKVGEAIGQRRVWREIGDLVRHSSRPLHLKEFCEYMKTHDMSLAAYHVRRAEAAGLIRKIGHQSGWSVAK